MLPKYYNGQPMRKCNSSNVGYENQLVEPPTILHVTKSTFFNSIPKLWNNRVTELHAKAPSIDAFKNHFKN